MKKAQICELLYKKELAEGIFDFRIKSGEMADVAKCGQFLHIDCGDGTLLRRPISICDVYDDVVRFVFEVKGKGTKALAQKKVGDTLDVLGPLGHGFDINDDYQSPVIVGGGIGIFPLYQLSKLVNNPAVYLGFRSANRVVMEDEFKSVAENTQIATDDGSYGFKGYAAELLKKHLDEKPCDIIYSCGPMPMLRAVKKIAEDYGAKCQLSLEQRMGCGIGACLVCSCETKREGTEKYAKVCKDGPVFWADEVTLND
ncbi:MAG: dihydroorotate dehydrogenase electron transfer subunit [Clostridia bacterium]|nr:dihydroorotate dehydrogenase electron transfer subunit [Clostridia bacterium]